MDIKAWMREALATGAFAEVDDIRARDLARAARVALRLPRTEAAVCLRWAEQVLAEPRPPRPPKPLPGPRCCRCGGLLWPARDAAPAKLAPLQPLAQDDPLRDFVRALARIVRRRVAAYEAAGLCRDCGGDC